MKMCSSPGCTKLDFHTGAHSFELDLKKRCQYVDTINESVVRSNNQFQHGIEFARMCISGQYGVELRLPEDLRSSGHEFFDAILLGSMSTKDDVAFAVDDLGNVLTLTATDLVRDDVVANWRPIADELHDKHMKALVGKEHDAAHRRTEYFVKTLRQHYKTTSKHKVYSLDGIGANRETYMRGYADLPSEATPEFYTFEIESPVALSQQLLYGKKTVIYTGALVREKFGYGCDGALPGKPCGIEYLINTRKNTSGTVNTLISKEDCEAVVGLNLDFCGGILGGLDFEEAQRVLLNLLSRLPYLVVLCITFGKRQRSGLKYEFEKYARTPYGFRVVHTFDGPADNQRVVSRLYVRVFAIPRTLMVPGGMWTWNMAKDKTLMSRLDAWKCVIKSIEPQSGAHILYSIDDDMDNQVLHELTVDDIHRWAIKDDCVRMVSAEDYEINYLEKICDAMEAEHKAAMALIRKEMHLKTAKPDIDTPIHKREYRCRKCGFPKKGHVCGKLAVKPAAAP